ncbi:DUF4864 domain-containing protein [Sulfitobacter sp. HNIBRBA3233]|uniref:DUF4864 domain-containing protein n=1 Tax=Sulfitobacter marinivivus TaxID=3158558 RepID=UPI0032DFDF07
MRTILQAAAFSLVFAFGADAQQTDIEATISRQIEAFKVDDFGTAFSFASPDLQRYFGSPETFGRMVTQGYPMVWRPADVRYLDLREEGGVYWQKVQITDLKGGFHILEYRMVQTDAGWRISGVQVLDAPGASV